MDTQRVIQPLRGSIDARRQLRPRDYFAHPDLFGEDPKASLTVLADGDEASQEIARVLHTVVCAWRRAPHAPSGAELARRLGFSRQTWSAITRGYRWPGHTLVVALLIGVNEGQTPPPQHAQTNGARPIPPVV